MRWGVLDANYSQRRYQGIAAQWLRWEAARLGVDLVEPEDADGLLVTTTSQQTLPQIRGALRRVKARGKPVVIGGAGAYGPAAFDGIADVVCVGEGRRFIGVLLRDGLDAAADLPEAWVQGETCEVVPHQGFPWDLPPVLHPDGKYRVFEARGCKHKCLFCQTGWERRYVENPDLGRLLRQCRELERRGLTYDLVTNDAGVTGLARKLHGNVMVSARFKHIEQWPMSQLPRTIRIGVEGISDRLRRAVAKPIPTDHLINLCYRMMAAGKSIKLFYVVGLPLEEWSDYEELGEFLSTIGRAPKGMCQILLHAFIPQPAAPLSVFPLADTYWEREEEVFRRFIDGALYSRRVNLLKPAMYPTRLKNSMMSMAVPEADLRRGWWHDDNPNWRVRYVAPPWKMRHMAAVYARHIGRPDAAPEIVRSHD